MTLTALHADKINLSQTKTALHRTRLRFLDRYNFSVFFFYKPDRQTAPVLAACGESTTEKIERNFSVFQFCGSDEDLMGMSTI
ncbi:TPA: hypothetical protein ACWQUH_003984 [Escherichia coli]|nr:hypothetical protein [Escherichia coli]EFC8797095.1 hypothetical protein [Escherichia coli]EFF9446818.1 hypothetical protein [Escherichia coli]EFH7172185.1 hypothetical protein [Escherichia coli]